MTKHIQIPVTFDSANRRKDRSVRLAFSTTRELDTAEYAELDRRVQEVGWVTFSPNELPEEDLPTEAAPGREVKSKGQRLRAVRFLIWKKQGIDEPFELWYDRWFERVMDQQKELLD